MNTVLSAIVRCSPVYALLFCILSTQLSPLKKNHRFLRTALSLLGFLLTSLCILLIQTGEKYTQYLEIFYYYAMYLIIGAILFICFDASVYAVTFSCTIGMIFQYTLYTISEIIRLSSAVLGHPFEMTSPAATAGTFFFYAAADFLAYVLLSKKRQYFSHLDGYVELLLAGLIIPIPLTIINQLIIFKIFDPLYLLFYRIYALFMCITLFIMILSLWRQKIYQREAERIRAVNLRQKEQYEFKKEVIDRINIRAHDLKKQLDHMESLTALYDQKAIENIRKELTRYDMLAHTGNETLDLILNDAAMQCEQKDIRFTFLLDGKSLLHVDPLDLYAIFGNLLDNAITGAATVPAVEQRVISCNEKNTGDCLYFHIFNTYKSNLSFSDGLPVTTNTDTENHGFGMKSVRSSLQKYGGELLVTADHDVFNANFMIKKQIL